MKSNNNYYFGCNSPRLHSNLCGLLYKCIISLWRPTHDQHDQCFFVKPFTIIYTRKYKLPFYTKRKILIVEYILLAQIRGGEFDPKYVKSSRVRTARNLRGLPFPPGTNRAQRREVHDTIVATLERNTTHMRYELHKPCKDIDTNRKFISIFFKDPRW